MSNEKDSAKRLSIYLAIVFAFSLLLVVFRKPMERSEGFSFIISQLYCASPAIACLITRAVTKEGFRDLKLHLHLRGNLRWYLLAFALPAICFSASQLLPFILSGHSGQLSGFTLEHVLSAFLSLVAQTAVLSVGLLGEELGWRGYMNQKMEPLFGLLGTCLIGGILWGLWHFPIDIANWLGGYASLAEALRTAFGRLAMLLCFGVFLMWLTKKTGSLFPAVVGHFMFNASQSALMTLLSLGAAPENTDPGAMTEVFVFVPMLILALAFMTLLLRDTGKRRI